MIRSIRYVVECRNLLSLSSQLLLLDLEDISDMVSVSGRLTPELSSHLCLNHFPQLSELQAQTCEVTNNY